MGHVKFTSLLAKKNVQFTHGKIAATIVSTPAGEIVNFNADGVVFRALNFDVKFNFNVWRSSISAKHKVHLFVGLTKFL